MKQKLQEMKQKMKQEKGSALGLKKRFEKQEIKIGSALGNQKLQD